MIGEAGDGTAGSEFGQEKPAHTIRFPEIPFCIAGCFFEQNSDWNFEKNLVF